MIYTCLILSCSPEINIFEAASNGCSVAAKTVAAVISNFIAFLAFLAWINSVLSWIGGMVGHEELSFEVKHIELDIFPNLTQL